jgi:cholestenol delta-isomerase
MTHHTAANSPDTEISHPYFPRDAPIQNYAPNVASLPVILVGFGALISVFVHRVVVVARRCNPELKKGYGDQLVVAWFALCSYPSTRLARHGHG